MIYFISYNVDMNCDVIGGKILIATLPQAENYSKIDRNIGDKKTLTIITGALFVYSYRK